MVKTIGMTFALFKETREMKQATRKSKEKKKSPL
jgi:hypothetical protein